MVAAPRSRALSDGQVALVLSGGNALGAYHAGLYEGLAEADMLPDWIVGASIGAIVGAIIAGNPPEERLAKLRKFWRPMKSGEMPLPWDLLPETWRRSTAALETMLAGRKGLFGPVGSGVGWLQRARGGTSALYDTRDLRSTLSEFVDFDLLNRGPVRFAATAVDIVSGEDVRFDTADLTVTPDHICASAALLSTFPAIEIGGRMLGDGGLSMNLPLDPVLGSSHGEPVLCIASDLLPLSSGHPRTLGEAIGRTQDLIFAAQTRRSIAHWQSAYAAEPSRGPVTLAKVSYSDQQREVAGKAMDFSPRTVQMRWDCGRRDASRLLKRLDTAMSIQQPGLSIISA